MNILGVGIATLDIVNDVDEYPPENSETRVRNQRISRGGNATNTLVVLNQLGHRCHWAGTLGDDPQSEFIKDDLLRRQVHLEHLTRCTRGRTPTSYVTLNRSTGSRTILHYRELPEYPAEAFLSIDLSTFDWIHFEGRNVDALGDCLRYASGFPGVRISLEVEKPRPGIEPLFSLVDLLLFSRVYARHRGFQRPEMLLEAVYLELGNQAPPLVCAWGASGAAMIGIDGKPEFSPSFPPVRIVDTLGAGDVFNAAIIDQLGRGHSAGDALRFACRLAGSKCGIWGLDALELD